MGMNDAAERERLQAQVRIERIKAQSARRDAEKIRRQAASEKQSLLDVLNDVLAENAALKQSAESLAACREQLRDAAAALEDVRGSISFRLLVTMGRPVAALRRMLRGSR